MNKKMLRIAGWALGLTLAVAGVGTAVGVSYAADVDPMVLRAASEQYSMTPNASTTGSASTSYITTLTEFTADGVKWKMNQWNPGTLQVRTNKSSASDEFRFYNTTAFPGKITKVVIKFSAFTVKESSKLMFLGGASEQNGTSGGTAGTYDTDAKTLTWIPEESDNFTYFAFYQNGEAASGTNKLATSDAIVVTYDVISASINGSSSAKAGTEWSPTNITENDTGNEVSGVSYYFTAVGVYDQEIDVSSWATNVDTGAFTPEEPCTVTVSAKKDGYSITDKVINVSYADVASISLSSYSTTIAKNAVFDLDEVDVTVNPAAYTEQVWTWAVTSNTVEDDYIFDDESNELLAGDTTGTITLTASSGSKTADFVVTVSTDPILNLDKDSFSAYVGGDAVTLVPTAFNFADGEVSYEWSSDNESVATVSDEGSVSFVGAGVANITAVGKVGGVKQAEAICAVKVVESLNPIQNVIDNDYSYIFEKKTFETYSTAVSLGKASWTAEATGGDYFGNDTTKGQQFGSGSASASALSLSSSDFSGEVSSVTVETSGGSKVSATVSVTVGGTAFKSDGDETKTITSDSISYVFTGSGSGEVVISWKQTTKKALYVKKIAVKYGSVTSYANVPGKEAEQEAVIAFAESVTSNLDAVCDKTSGSTNLDELNNRWTAIKTVFDEKRGSLTDEGKAHFDALVSYASKDAAGDKLQKALSSYDYVASKYGAQLSAGDFLHSVSSRNAATYAVNNRMGFLQRGDNSMKIALVATLLSAGAVAAIGICFANHKRKKN